MGQKENELAEQIQRWQINYGMVLHRQNQNAMPCLQRAGDIRLLYQSIEDIYPDLDMNKSLTAAMSKFTGDDCRDVRAVNKVFQRLAMQLHPERLQAKGKSTEQIALG